MDVVWEKAKLPVPSPEDLRVEPTDHPLVANDVPLVVSSFKNGLQRYLEGPDHRAVALTAGRSMFVTKRSSRAEATRLAVERCSAIMSKPCLLLAVGNSLTIQIPKTRRVTDIFLPATHDGFSPTDRSRIGQVYRGREWRALAHGNKGTWHPIAGAASETAAISEAMAACEKVDESCQLFAIGNFLVAPQ